MSAQVIRNGVLIDGTGADPVENGAVLIQDGKIKAAGALQSLPQIAGVEEIDARGGYILPEGFYEQLAKQANAQVEKAAKALEKEGVAAVGVAVDQQAATAIVEEARARKADLIVMGTRGLTGIKHLALGSVADRVVRTAPCPVLTVGGED